MKNEWTHGPAYFATGDLGTRRIVTTEDGEMHIDEYVVLVLGYTNEEGEVIRYDAVADSPITGRNAAQVHRGDVSDEPWDIVFSMRKPQAQYDEGLRAVPHREGGAPMKEKFINLLTCTEESFLYDRVDRLKFPEPEE